MTIWPGLDSYALLTTQKLIWSANLRTGLIPAEPSGLHIFARSVQDLDDIDFLREIALGQAHDERGNDALSALWHTAGSFSFLSHVDTEIRFRHSSRYLESLRRITGDIWDVTRWEVARHVLSLLSAVAADRPGADNASVARDESEVVRYLLSLPASQGEARSVWLTKEFAKEPDVFTTIRSRASSSSDPSIYLRVLAHWTAARDLDDVIDRARNPGPNLAPLFLNAVAAYAIRMRDMTVFHSGSARARHDVAQNDYEELRGYVAVHIVGADDK